MDVTRRNLIHGRRRGLGRAERIAVCGDGLRVAFRLYNLLLQCGQPRIGAQVEPALHEQLERALELLARGLHIPGLIIPLRGSQFLAHLLLDALRSVRRSEGKK